MGRLWRMAGLCMAVATLALSSCASKGAVSVSGSIGNPAVTVTKGILVTTLQGSFDVALELGERASSSTDVTLVEFSLLRASDGIPVLAKEKLSVLPSVPGPVHLEPGGTATVHFQIGDARNGAVVPLELDQDDYDSVCNAGQLVIRGTMQDSANGAATTPLSSAAFSPSGC